MITISHNKQYRMTKNTPTSNIHTPSIKLMPLMTQTDTRCVGRCGDLDAAFGVVESYPGKYGFKVNAQVRACLRDVIFARIART